ncbi:MAG: histidine triad nucleotide-binding protein [Nitrospirota bacterium]
MSDCVFCNIGSGQIPSRMVLQDEEVFAFEDLNPQAPVHVLVIPKRHVAAMNELQDAALLGRLFHAANLVAQKKGIAASGYRVVANTGRDGGQSVFHLHLHVLGGRQMNWPPG